MKTISPTAESRSYAPVHPAGTNRRLSSAEGQPAGCRDAGVFRATPAEATHSPPSLVEGAVRLGRGGRAGQQAVRAAQVVGQQLEPHLGRIPGQAP